LLLAAGELGGVGLVDVEDGGGGVVGSLFELLQGVLCDIVGFGASWCVVVGCATVDGFLSP